MSPGGVEPPPSLAVQNALSIGWEGAALRLELIYFCRVLVSIYRYLQEKAEQGKLESVVPAISTRTSQTVQWTHSHQTDILATQQEDQEKYVRQTLGQRKFDSSSSYICGTVLTSVCSKDAKQAADSEREHLPRNGDSGRQLPRAGDVMWTAVSLIVVRFYPRCNRVQGSFVWARFPYGGRSRVEEKVFVNGYIQGDMLFFTLLQHFLVSIAPLDTIPPSEVWFLKGKTRWSGIAPGNMVFSRRLIPSGPRLLLAQRVLWWFAFDIRVRVSFFQSSVSCQLLSSRSRDESTR
ncbi:hypothetical protein C8R45DRAFT_930574 [Mycena sanguinolenta]|nr:hypothetical protein C8R45DRAFT_930574 [Mycena sanguinolenta]